MYIHYTQNRKNMPQTIYRQNQKEEKYGKYEIQPYKVQKLQNTEPSNYGTYKIQ